MSRAIEEINLVSTLSKYCFEKLEQNSHKDHWGKERMNMLFYYLYQEITEIQSAMLTRESPEAVWREAADVANFVAMIADNYEKGKK